MADSSLSISVDGAGLGFNLFTGDPGLKYREFSDKWDGPNGSSWHSVYKELNGQPRLGALYLIHGDKRFGLNSERARHFLQNKLAHDWLRGSDNWFEFLPRPGKCYGGIYRTSKYSLWQ